MEGALEGALEGGFEDGELVGWVVSHTGVWRRLLRGLWTDGVARGGFFSFLFFSRHVKRRIDGTAEAN